VLCLVVQRYIVIQRSVHRPGAQAQRNSPQAQQQKAVGEGKPGKSGGGHKHTCHRHNGGAEAPDAPFTQDTRNDRSPGSEHGNNAGVTRRPAALWGGGHRPSLRGGAGGV